MTRVDGLCRGGTLLHSFGDLDHLVLGLWVTDGSLRKAVR